jgi:adenylate cyclase
MKICEPGVIDKTRYEVPAGLHRWEVDEFHGDNEGLVVAELELADENDAFIKPGWIGTEVTGKVEYYNAMLMKTPYRRWPKTQRP